MFPTGSERAELDVYSNWNHHLEESGLAFTNSFAHRAANPFKTGFDSSGVGMFINFMLNTGQSDFRENETSNPQSGIVHFCDKAGEICGAWIVLSSVSQAVKWVGDVGISKASFYLTRQKEAQYIVENAVSINRATCKTEEVIGPTRQFMGEEVGSIPLTQTGSNNINQRVSQLESKISEWLGNETRMVKNKAGDPVFISMNGSKRVRFDFNNTHGDRAHMHIEIKMNKKWKDATNLHRIYPLE